MAAVYNDIDPIDEARCVRCEKSYDRGDFRDGALTTQWNFPSLFPSRNLSSISGVTR